MRSKIGVAGAVALAVLALAGCSSPASDSSGSSGGDDSGPIVIGGAIASTGFMSSYDQPAWAALKIGVDEVNASGGIDGRTIELIQSDSASTTEGASKAATDLLAKGADILAVTSNFDLGSPAGNVAQDAGVLNISLAAASPKYGVQGIGPQAFTGAIATYNEGAAIAQYFKEKGWTTAVAFEDTSLDYSTEVCAGFRERAELLGITVSDQQFKNDDKSIASQITAIKSDAPHAVALCSYPPGGATALREMRAAGLEQPIMSGVGMGGTFWIDAVPDLSNFYTASMVSVFGDDPDPAVNDFVAKFTKETGAAPTTDVALAGYTVSQMVIEALKATNGDTDGAALTAALEKFQQKQLLTGKYTFNSTTHIAADSPASVIEYTNGVRRAHRS
jgi:branched-chain amino acid transport system substrate-binding protein